MWRIRLIRWAVGTSRRRGDVAEGRAPIARAIDGGVNLLGDVRHSSESTVIAEAAGDDEMTRKVIRMKVDRLHHGADRARPRSNAFWPREPPIAGSCSGPMRAISPPRMTRPRSGRSCINGGSM